MTGGLASVVSGALQEELDRARVDLGYPTPACRLVVDGRDITTAITTRLIELTLTDNRGMEADTLDIRLSDHDGLLAIPPRGAQVRLWLGWSDTGLVDKGAYTVDEVEHSGAPDVLSIRARSADLRAGLARKRERSWHRQRLGDLVRGIAAEYSLQPLIDAALAAIGLPHIDQANESDLNLLSRLSQDHDAIASVKAGRLLFLPVGAGRSASGLPLPHIHLTRADGDQHRYLSADRDSYSGVRTHYYDPHSAERKEVVAGGTDNAKTLRHPFTDRDSALRAARSEWKRLQRGTATLSYSLAKGRADLIPELTYTLEGVKPEISAITWLGGSVTHSLSSNGFTTDLELQSQLPDDEELFSDDQDYTGVYAWYREKGGEQKKVTRGDQSRPRRLTHLYASKGNAERAVEREWKRLQQGQAAPG